MLHIDIDERKGLVVLEPDASLSKDDFERATSQINPMIEKFDGIKGLIIHVKDFPSWDSFGALVEHLKFVHNHHKKIEKLAFVTDSSVIDILEPIAKHFVHPEVKEFAYNELVEAKIWIEKNETILTHGLSMGIKRVNENSFFLSFKAIGTLTHEDYVRITPILEAALAEVKEPKINVFMDISQLKGWKARAAWDDFKIGLKYNFKFDKIAIYGHNTLVDYGVKIASWFMSGEIKEFENRNEALRWING